MSSADERILQSVDDVISAIDRLLEEIQAAPAISLEQKTLAIQKASEVTLFLDELNSILVPDESSYFGEVDGEDDRAGVLSPAEALQPRLIITPFDNSAPVSGNEMPEAAPLVAEAPVGSDQPDEAEDVGADNESPAAEIRLEDEIPAAEPDELTLIAGIDADTEALLNDAGIYRFADIAAFKEADIQAISPTLGDPVRVALENWVEQAALLERGTATLFAAPQMGQALFDRASLNAAYHSAEPVERVPVFTIKEVEPETEEAPSAVGDAALENSYRPADVFAAAPLSETEDAGEAAAAQGETDTERLERERALLEAELDKLKAELAAQSLGKTVDEGADVVVEPLLEADVAAETAETFVTSEADEEPEAPSDKPEDIEQDEVYANAAALARDGINEKDLVRGAIWHEEVSTAANYVPPSEDEPGDEPDYADGFDAGGFTPVFGPEVMDGADQPEQPPLAGGQGLMPEDEISQPHHDELAGLASVLERADGMAEGTPPDETMAAREESPVLPPSDISLPNTRDKQDSFVSRAFPQETPPVEDKPDAVKEAAQAAEDQPDEDKAGLILPFPPAKDGKAPLVPPLPGRDGAVELSQSLTEGPEERPVEGAPKMGPQFAKRPFSGAASPLAGRGVKPPMPPGAQPESREQEAGNGADKGTLKQGTLKREAFAKGAPFGAPLPPRPPVPPVFQKGAPPAPREGAMPPPTPPAGGPPAGRPPIAGPPRARVPVGGPPAGAVPFTGPRPVVQEADGEKMTGLPPRSPDELYIAPDAPSPEDGGRPDGAFADTAEAEGRKAEAETVSGDAEPVEDIASPEEDESSSLGQYLARKRGDTGGPQFRPVAPPPGAPPAHHGMNKPPQQGMPLPPRQTVPMGPNGVPLGPPPKAMGQAPMPGANNQGAKMPGAAMQGPAGRVPPPGMPPHPSHAGMRPKPGAPADAPLEGKERSDGANESEKARVPEGFHARARQFAEKLERSFVEDED